MKILCTLWIDNETAELLLLEDFSFDSETPGYNASGEVWATVKGSAIPTHSFMDLWLEEV